MNEEEKQTQTEKEKEEMEQWAEQFRSLLPSPEEIMKTAGREAYNDNLRMERVARLTARKNRVAKKSKPKKQKRR